VDVGETGEGTCLVVCLQAQAEADALPRHGARLLGGGSVFHHGLGLVLLRRGLILLRRGLILLLRGLVLLLRLLDDLWRQLGLGLRCREQRRLLLDDWLGLRGRLDNWPVFVYVFLDFVLRKSCSRL
jgi:hypothetical protein